MHIGRVLASLVENHPAVAVAALGQIEPDGALRLSAAVDLGGVDEVPAPRLEVVE